MWVARITLPNGHKRVKYNKSQQVVKDWLLAERSKLAQGIYVTDERLTVENFLHRYLNDYAKHSVRPTTYSIYEGWIRRHIIPQLGKVRLRDLRTIHINQLMEKMRSLGLSNRSVAMTHGVLKLALNKAVRWELIPKNPANLSTPPKSNYKPPTVWSREQVKTFLKSLDGDRWAGIYYLAMVGMRKGEILEFPLSALSLDEGYLMVTQTLQFIPGTGIVFQPPKTARSKRLIRFRNL